MSELNGNCCPQQLHRMLTVMSRNFERPFAPQMAPQGASLAGLGGARLLVPLERRHSSEVEDRKRLKPTELCRGAGRWEDLPAGRARSMRERKRSKPTDSVVEQAIGRICPRPGREA